MCREAAEAISNEGRVKRTYAVWFIKVVLLLAVRVELASLH